MTQIDVAHDAEHRLQTAVETVYKQYRHGRAIWVFCTDEQRLHAFSKMLWSCHDTEFIPHQHIQEGIDLSLVQLCSQDPSNALIEWQKQSTPQVQNEQTESTTTRRLMPLLLNLDIACPPNYQRFDRVLEIVSRHPVDMDYARQRMQTYKTEGAKVVFHKLRTA